MSGTRKIIVTGKKVVHTGTNQKTQQEFHIWQLDATKEDGSPITEKLRTFEDLPNGPVDVTIEPYNHEKYGLSYTVKRVKEGGGGGGGNPGSRLGPKVDELRARVEKLERDVAGLLTAPPAPGIAAPAESNVRQPEPSGSTFGEDPPF